MIVPEGISLIQLVAFAKKNIKINGWDSLKGWRVAYIRGGEIVKTRIDQYLIEGYELNSSELAIKFLDADRTDIIIGNRLIFNLAIEKYSNTNQIKEVGIFDEDSASFIYLNKRFEKYVITISKAIRTLREDGTLKGILLKLQRE